MPSQLGDHALPDTARVAPVAWPDGDADSAETDLPVAMGDTLAGRYVVERVLGNGGMGIVCGGRHRELDQLVAIKFLRKRFVVDKTVTARFLEEARAAAALRSDHVVRVMDVGQTESAVPYYVMEHLEGVDLETLLVREGPLRIEKAIDYVRQACAGLHEAHALGIVHRDVKPENLFLCTRGTDRPVLKVVDFGIAKRLDPARAKVVTGPQESMGSPCYMSPEQMWTPRTIDTRTDVWSLGVVLYQLLTGAVPFDAETVSDIFAKVAGAEYLPMSALRPDVDPFLEAIVKRCLAKSLDERYASVDALSRDLQNYEATVRKTTDPAGRGKSPFPPRARSDAPVSSPVSSPVSRIPARGPEAQSTLWGWLVVAAGVAIVAGVVTARKAPDTAVGRVTSHLLDRALGALPLPPEGPDAPAALSAVDDEPVARSLLAYVVDPLGVLAADAPGARDLRAEREHEDDQATPAVSLTEEARKAQKERAYRRYLSRHGLRPIREVLEEMGTN